MDKASVVEMTQLALSIFVEYGIKVVGALAILIVGWIAARWVKSTVLRILSRGDRVDDMVRTLAASAARYLVLAVTVITVLGQFGVQTASLIAVLGTMGLAIGLAMQGTLSNVAAGVMLLLFRPFNIGDFVETAGVSGTVKTLNLFTTELTTADNVHIIAPNSHIWGCGG